MSEIYQKDESIHEPTTAHIHPLETTPQGSQADSAEGTHEHRDVSFSALGKWFTGLFIGVALSFVLMYWFFFWAVDLVKTNDETPSATFTQRDNLQRAWPDTREESPLEKPGDMPTLLPDPEAPMRKLQKQDEATLSTYNWVKNEKGQRTGAVSIPVDRAIELTAQRGLPSDNKTNLRPLPPTGEPVRLREPH